MVLPVETVCLVPRMVTSNDAVSTCDTPCLVKPQLVSDITSVLPVRQDLFGLFNSLFMMVLLWPVLECTVKLFLCLIQKSIFSSKLVR